MRRKDIDGDIVWTDKVLMKTEYQGEIVSRQQGINEGKVSKGRISKPKILKGGNAI